MRYRECIVVHETDPTHYTTKEVVMSRTISVVSKKVVMVTKDHGGYESGRCIACGTGGWLKSPYGYPHHARSTLVGNELIHKEDCPMNEVLNSDGSMKD